MFSERELDKFIDSKLHPPTKPAKAGTQALLGKLRLLTQGRKLPRLPKI